MDASVSKIVINITDKMVFWSPEDSGEINDSKRLPNRFFKNTHSITISVLIGNTQAKRMTIGMTVQTTKFGGTAQDTQEQSTT